MWHHQFLNHQSEKNRFPFVITQYQPIPLYRRNGGISLKSGVNINRI